MYHSPAFYRLCAVIGSETSCTKLFSTIILIPGPFPSISGKLSPSLPFKLFWLSPSPNTVALAPFFAPASKLARSHCVSVNVCISYPVRSKRPCFFLLAWSSIRLADGLAAPYFEGPRSEVARPEERPMRRRKMVKRGRRVARLPAVIARPISTVDQMAMSTVSQRKSLLRRWWK